MNKQGLIAIFAVSLLLITASSAMITSEADAYSASNKGKTLDSDFTFDEVTRETIGSTDIFTMEKTVTSESLFGDTVIDDLTETVHTFARITADNSNKILDIEIIVKNDLGEILLEFEDTISNEGITPGNELIYNDLVPRIQPMSDTAVIEGTWNLIKYLQEVVDDIKSTTLHKKVVEFLAKPIVKKLAIAAVTAVIPVVGWALSLINVGLSIADIYNLLKELPDLVRTVQVDIEGCIYNAESNTIEVAERYSGADRTVAALHQITDYSYRNLEAGKYYLAYVNHDAGIIFTTGTEISKEHALAILEITNISDIELGKGLSVYTVNEEQAKELAILASGGEPIVMHHTKLHDDLNYGMMHYHHALHTENDFPAHVFYGEMIL